MGKINNSVVHDARTSDYSNVLGDISMTIYYLYVKTHNITGLKYLGFTSANPYTYRGTGDYWKAHINKHEYDVTTEILKECSTKDEIKHWGLY